MLSAPSPLPSATSWANAMRGWLYFGEDLAPTPGRHPAHRRHAAVAPGRDHHVEQLVAQRTQQLEGVITQLRARQQELESQAHYDYLTGLANRKLLQDRFQCAQERAKRNGTLFALLMIDLNGFKTINDTHGHAAGDIVLQTVAKRLVATLRTCDTAARIGGDEFVLILEALHHPQEVVHISRKLVRALSDDIPLDSGEAVRVGASMGLALCPNDGTDLARLLCVADRAMYECKATGQMGL